MGSATSCTAAACRERARTAARGRNACRGPTPLIAAHSAARDIAWSRDAQVGDSWRSAAELAQGQHIGAREAIAVSSVGPGEQPLVDHGVESLAVNFEEVARLVSVDQVVGHGRLSVRMNPPYPCDRGNTAGRGTAPLRPP